MQSARRESSTLTSSLEGVPGQEVSVVTSLRVSVM